jgi:hypothetical protein
VREHDGPNRRRVPLRSAVGRRDALSVELAGDAGPPGSSSVSLGVLTCPHGTLPLYFTGVRCRLSRTRVWGARNRLGAPISFRVSDRLEDWFKL